MKKFVFGTLVSAALLLPVYAQDSKPMPEVAKRKVNQQKRIGNGVKSGALTAKETNHLEKREADLNKTTQAERAANGGKLTAGEKKVANARQNNISKKIYQAKHNNTTRQNPKQ